MRLYFAPTPFRFRRLPFTPFYDRRGEHISSTFALSFTYCRSRGFIGLESENVGAKLVLSPQERLHETFRAVVSICSPSARIPHLSMTSELSTLTYNLFYRGGLPVGAQAAEYSCMLGCFCELSRTTEESV